MGMTKTPCELVGGMYDGTLGEVAYDSDAGPPSVLKFKDEQFVYALDTRRRYKVHVYDERGTAHAVPGFRYRYDAAASPIEPLLRQADAEARAEALRTNDGLILPGGNA